MRCHPDDPTTAPGPLGFPPDAPSPIHQVRGDLPAQPGRRGRCRRRHLLQLWTKWDQVLGSENPAAYAWGILRNKISDHAKARNRRPLLDEAAFDTAALRHAVDPIGQITESLALFRALRTLTDRQMDVMVMVYLHGLTPEEVGAALGITAPTVRSTARHARRRLREIVGPDRTMEGRADDLTR
ncbi:RNA polymerase sigma factor [Streptomyces sp. NPDC002018]|uniref:RNA polymerase sigma factor n=1 Tax=Streptomyces sp. NPDC002018 TaxID=3364629 RepID=UPI00367FD6F4